MSSMTPFSDLKLDFLPGDLAGTYLVGGALRDLLTGRSPADIDLVTRQDLACTANRIAEKTGGSIIDLGKKGFNLLRVASPQAIIDITPLTHSSIEANLRQRDFTINAIAYDIRARRVIDCTGGLADMRKKIIRLVSPQAFEKDPVRLVRAYRLAAVFHFSLCNTTQAAIGRYGHLVGRVAGERVWAELVKLFTVADSAPVIRQMAASGLFTAIFPELIPALGCTQNIHHRFDVFDHSLLAYESLEVLMAEIDHRFPDLAAVSPKKHPSGHAVVLKYAALLHDVGKPVVRQVGEHGRVRFHGHAAKSADIALIISQRLRLSKSQRKVADAIIRHHIRPLFLFLASQKGQLGERGIIRFFKRSGPLTLLIVIHAMADIMSKDNTLKPRDAEFIAFCEDLLKAYIAYNHRQAAVPHLISGHDLIEIFGLSPSPRFKHILNQVDERRLTGELATRNQALRWVKSYLLKTQGYTGA